LDNEIPRDTKIVPDWLLDKIDERGIAIWFMDNGSICKYENIFKGTYNRTRKLKLSVLKLAF